MFPSRFRQRGNIEAGVRQPEKVQPRAHRAGEEFQLAAVPGRNSALFGASSKAPEGSAQEREQHRLLQAWKGTRCLKSLRCVTRGSVTSGAGKGQRATQGSPGPASNANGQAHEAGNTTRSEKHRDPQRGARCHGRRQAVGARASAGQDAREARGDRGMPQKTALD